MWLLKGKKKDTSDTDSVSSSVASSKKSTTRNDKPGKSSTQPPLFSLEGLTNVNFDHINEDGTINMSAFNQSLNMEDDFMDLDKEPEVSEV